MESGEKVLTQLRMSPFTPHPLLTNPHLQTILGSYLPQKNPRNHDKQYILTLEDEDQLVLIENRPSDWKDGQRIVVLVHGLTGASDSNYMVRFAEHFFKQGCLVIRVNLRGCGPGFGLAKKPYHSGRSEDTRAVLCWLQRHFPASPVTQIGFSLGANIILKMAGEDGDAPSGNLDSLVAVSPPSHLSGCAQKLLQPENWIFNRYFVWRLKLAVRRYETQFPDAEKITLPRNISLRDFDDLYTAKVSGFASSEDYYTKSSSLPLLPNITVPSLIVCALDDPVVDASCFANFAPPPNMELILSPLGGHVGFIGTRQISRGIRWLDEVVLRWVHHRTRPQKFAQGNAKGKQHA